MDRWGGGVALPAPTPHLVRCRKGRGGLFAAGQLHLVIGAQSRKN
jgi:hypothetical protein